MTFQRFRKNRLIKIVLLLFLILILIRPKYAIAGASSGLLLWFESVLPNLLPFMIVSGLIVKLQITRPIGRILYPFFKFLFPIHVNGCYPIFIGFLSGIPVGAKTSADLYNNGQLDIKEAQFLTNMCNNASPMFILGYIATTKLLLPDIGPILILLVYVSSMLGASLCYRLPVYKRLNTPSKLTTSDITHPVASKNNVSFSIQLLDETILSAFEVVTKVGGYIILFSVFAAIINSFGFLPPLISAVLTGLIEITVGIHNLSTLPLATHIKIVLITTITAFGGFSGLAQTKSVIGATGLSIGIYLYSRLLTSVIALLLSSAYVLLLL